MNKTEKLISLILGGILVWYVFTSGANSTENKKTETAASEQSEVQKAEGEEKIAPEASDAVQAEAPSVEAKSEIEIALPPEEIKSLENELVKLDFTTHGAGLKAVTLKKYAVGLGEISENNPALTMDFSENPLGELVLADAKRLANTVKSVSENEIVFENEKMERKYTILPDYSLRLEETLKAGAAIGENRLSLGMMAMDSSENGMLSVDSWVGSNVIHHDDDDSPLKSWLVGNSGGCGCGSSRKVEGTPRLSGTIAYDGHQDHIALKNRFFVSALVKGAANKGFETIIARDMKSSNYRPDGLFSSVKYEGMEKSRTSEFYIGPKKQSLLWALDMKDTMEFGMWRWLGYPIVWVINFFTTYIHSVGVAIILLTVLLRVVFWPLTRKSTEGMKKMQEIQPKLKEIQQKFKDNPQRLQQETWAIYRENKVNPMSSCLPLLIQIPIFIALYNVLKSAVELRYASFLWIADLSEPEGLFKAYLPFGGLNILPILMAATMALQSALTPSTGDKNQQKMMVVFMPIMMLVMFYNFPSALALYWTLSQVLSIFQMWLMRRKQNAATQSSEVIAPDLVIDPPQTRQMRRHN